MKARFTSAPNGTLLFNGVRGFLVTHGSGPLEGKTLEAIRLANGITAAPPLPPPVPAIITPLQFRSQLREEDKLELLTQAVPDGSLSDFFEYGLEFKRVDSKVIALLVLVGIEGVALDNFFFAAAAK